MKSPFADWLQTKLIEKQDQSIIKTHFIIVSMAICEVAEAIRDHAQSTFEATLRKKKRDEE